MPPPAVPAGPPIALMPPRVETAPAPVAAPNAGRGKRGERLHRRDWRLQHRGERGPPSSRICAPAICPVFQVSRQGNSGKVFWLVYLGPFADRESAEAARGTAREAGIADPDANQFHPRHREQWIGQPLKQDLRFDIKGTAPGLSPKPRRRAGVPQGHP